MATLSWQIHEEQLQIVYSHDLHISDSKAASVVKETRNDKNLLSISENSIGNSWITANDFGYIFYLITITDPSLNKRDADPLENCRELIKSLSEINSLWNLRKTIQALHIGRYNPFRLFVFPGINPPVQWKWDGKKISELLSPPQFIHMSPFAPTRVQKNSYRKFQKATNGFLTSIPFDLQKSLHNPKEFLLNALWKNSKTGMTCICVDRLSVKMRYLVPGSATASEEQIKLKTGRTQTRQGGHLSRQPGKTDKDPINIDQIFRAKNPALRGKIPDFLFGFIKKVIKEKAVNNILNHIRNLPPDRFASVILNHIQVSGSVRPGFPQLPTREKRPVFLANHPTGGIDGLLLLSWLLNYYPDIKLLGNDVLQEIPHLDPYMVPVDRFGGRRASVRRIFEVFASDTPLIIFPSGTTARKHRGELVEGPWQKMPVRMAFKSDRILIPLHIRGWNSFLFYWTASIRRALNLDLNLEMLLLPREFLNPVCKEFTVSVGPGFTRNDLESLGKTDQQRIDRLQKICQQLSAEHIDGD